MNEVEMFNEIARIRGCGVDLMHRVINEFDYFCSSVIFGEDSPNAETRAIYKFGKKNKFQYEGDETFSKWT